MSILFPLASHPDSEEYQVERTIVWIMIPNQGSRSNWVTEGRAMFHAVWRDTNEVIRMAQLQSRIEHPEFWDQPWLGLMDEPILAVQGIWIYPVEGTALYEVYDASGGYIPNGLSGHTLPDDYMVDIARGRDGKLAIKP
ncbi:MAG: hypothetical protein JNL58_30235 [Planctomyces sp.]|nr:hypothetical protein [Planctomyces sp.]